MKYIWEEEDVVTGNIVTKKNHKYMIGWKGVISKGVYLVQLESDGMIVKFADNKKEAADRLTNSDYKPFK